MVGRRGHPSSGVVADRLRSWLLKSRRHPQFARRTLFMLHAAAIVSFLVLYLAVSVLAGVSAVGQLQRWKRLLYKPVLCGSEVKYLCWDMRTVLDASFRGDMAVLARHIARMSRERLLLSSDSDGTGGSSSSGRSRGIVVPAGGQKYAANAFINIYVLRRFLNCTLPVALMYWGKSQKDALNRNTLKFMKAHLPDVEFVDASSLPYPTHHRWLFPPDDDSLFNGWKVKVFALYSAPFDEVLLMDSDSTPFQDLAPLFEHPAYREHGSMFWPDPFCHEVQLFRYLNVTDPWRDGRREWQTESGQLLFNRRLHSDVLEWLLFLNTHDEVTYHYAYGDKDTFRAAFYLANRSKSFFQVDGFSVPLYRATRYGGKMQVRGLFQQDPEGRLLFLHRAGEGQRKYEADSDEGRPISHVLAQPSCDWATQKNLFGTSLTVSERSIHTPSSCSYDLTNVRDAQRACGPSGRAEEGRGLAPGAAHPMVFEVTSEMHVAQVQQQADAAFRLLTEHKGRDPELF